MVNADSMCRDTEPEEGQGEQRRQNVGLSVSLPPQGTAGVIPRRGTFFFNRCLRYLLKDRKEPIYREG